ncbi:hypothetical protein Clacol_008827 [Clathrus columnatus]|uniref:Uncharacterized protein n=1 Tax=Clathrus columnatus TaxID=1419009 RepID=A0AAV5ALK2_9AGAM|nr:hypothetical protein Clacol_008827 [Clathrus columnatus]
MIAKLPEVFSPKLGIGYDIGCSFTSTLKRSSLGPQVQERDLRLVIPTFHGYAHNHFCQLKYHILMNHRFGLEDLETCEQVFSSSNFVARATQHATAYHRHQFIEMYFRQWDEDKYLALGVFLMNNYKQALQLIDQLPIQISALTSGQKPPDVPYTRWLEVEYNYLLNKQMELEEYGLETDYVTLLQKHDEAFIVIELQHDLQVMEVKLGITDRWTSESLEYKKAMEYLQHREYYHSVEKLEGLVIQCLFEMAKANASGTGMYLAAQTRSKAIHCALNTYNKLANLMQPPRPTLSWTDIVEYSTIAEFDLLQVGLQGDV